MIWYQVFIDTSPLFLFNIFSFSPRNDRGKIKESCTLSMTSLPVQDSLGFFLGLVCKNLCLVTV